MWFKILLLSIFGFTSSLTTSFDLRGVIHGDRMAGVPLGSSLGAGEVDVEGVCSQSGMACQNCSLAITCIPLPVGWLKVPLEECAVGQTCNAHIGGCSTTPVPECDGSKAYTHSCEQVGIFPDAHDCRRFHLCSPPQGLPDGKPAYHGVALCPRNYGYNPQTAQCSMKLPHGQCKDTPVPICTKVGDSGAVKSSLNHYFVCLMKHSSLYPQIFICPHGWYFWGGFCRPEAEPSSSQEPVLATSLGSNSTESTTNSVVTTNKSTEKITEAATEKIVYKINSFFSTEKASTYAPDTFLADKIDLTNYEAVDGDEAGRVGDDWGIDGGYFYSNENFNN